MYISNPRPYITAPIFKAFKLARVLYTNALTPFTYIYESESSASHITRRVRGPNLNRLSTRLFLQIAIIPIGARVGLLIIEAIRARGEIYDLMAHFPTRLVGALRNGTILFFVCHRILDTRVVARVWNG